MPRGKSGTSSNILVWHQIISLGNYIMSENLELLYGARDEAPAAAQWRDCGGRE